jgi:hypothetical protein
MRTGSPRIRPSSCRRRVPHDKWGEPTGLTRSLHSTTSAFIRCFSCSGADTTAMAQARDTPSLSEGHYTFRRVGVLSRAVDAGTLGPGWEWGGTTVTGGELNASLSWVSLDCVSSVVSMALGARGRRMRDGTPERIVLFGASVVVRRGEVGRLVRAIEERQGREVMVRLVVHGGTSYLARRQREESAFRWASLASGGKWMRSAVLWIFTRDRRCGVVSRVQTSHQTSRMPRIFACGPCGWCWVRRYIAAVELTRNTCKLGSLNCVTA